MAEIVLSKIGQAAGSRLLPSGLSFLGGNISGAAIGGALGSLAGRAIDARFLTPPMEGPRLKELHILSSREGAPIYNLYGRMRLSGQVIWAAKLKEHSSTSSSGGGKGGPRVTEYDYTLSFAIGLCEGVAARIDRAWANGDPLNLSDYNVRFYGGSEDQLPDPVIEAVEGSGNAPAYRGLSYVVFEDFPLSEFGNRLPQFSFEVVRPTPDEAGTRLEQVVKGVDLIPASGEFSYGTTIVKQVLGPGVEGTENTHADPNQTDFLTAIDQLERDFPNAKSVALVVGWFGTDLRCGHCEIKPGVETHDKNTSPYSWRVNGVTRGSAHLISQDQNSRPAYGGTPSDRAIFEAITELKARGFKVSLYPFIFMDIASSNALPDPYGDIEQAAYPWRGRITCYPAIGQAGSPDQTSVAETQVASIFGAASAGDFSPQSEHVDYSGPNEWSIRRFILHYAHLAELAGGVDAFLIGSEMRALTTIRDGAASFPAVAEYQALAAEVRSVVGPSTKISYAADWSEYQNYRPQDGSNDVLFHLDPLWADPNIDFVGIDWYAPVSDWRDGNSHLDKLAGFEDAYDEAYLSSHIEGGEHYDWYYASEADRSAQVRTPITDTAHGEDWVFRSKDIKNWWLNAHHNRPGGVRDAGATGWVPQSKPVWLVELGVPAIDKGTNSPNLFVDEKSSENAVPPYSSGARDDLIQRRGVEALYHYWDVVSGNNPISALYAGPMIPEEGQLCWAYDARPYPHFPARDDIWGDAPNWRRGHWLNGRAGLAPLAEVVEDLCHRAGVFDIDTSGLNGIVTGYALDSSMTLRGALEQLRIAYGFEVIEREGTLHFVMRPEDVSKTILIDNLVLQGEAAHPLTEIRQDGDKTPELLRVSFIDGENDYLVGTSFSGVYTPEAQGSEVALPLVMDHPHAENLAERLLADTRAQADTAEASLSLRDIDVEAGDLISVSSDTGTQAFRVSALEEGVSRALSLTRQIETIEPVLAAGDPQISYPSATPARAQIWLIDPPVMPGYEDDERPLVAVFGDPWGGDQSVWAGPDGATLTKRATASTPATIGEVTNIVDKGFVGRWDYAHKLQLKLHYGDLSSAMCLAVLNGANGAFVETQKGWELIQFRDAQMLASGEFELSILLRGQQGTDQGEVPPIPPGARFVLVNDALIRADIADYEIGLDLRWKVGPADFNPDTGFYETDWRFDRIAWRPWAPACVAYQVAANDDIEFEWTRRTRKHGDSLDLCDPPIIDSPESYQLEIVDAGGAIVRTETLLVQNYVYPSTDRAADLGSMAVDFEVRVAQLSPNWGVGARTALSVSV